MTKKEIVDLLETFEDNLEKIEIVENSCEKIEEVRQQLSLLLKDLSTDMITPALFNHIEELDNKIVDKMWVVKRKFKEKA